jgi:hypothetical protein
MKLAIRITTTGEVTDLDLSTDSLQTLQTAVGGWVQVIDLDDSLSMWLNEEGKLVGLPHNPYAQFAWDKTFGAHTDYMVGDVVFTGGTDDEGATLGLDSDTADQIRMMVERVRNTVEPRVEVVFE